MVKRDEIFIFIQKTIGQDLLEKAVLKDENANGVQFNGGGEISVVCCGVTLTEEFLQKAVSLGSNFVILHHGFDTRIYKSLYSLSSQKRLKIIIKNDITVVGLHYALDAHPVLGNNAQIIAKLGAKIVDTLYDQWGLTAEFRKPVAIDNLEKQMEQLVGRKIIKVLSGPKMIKRIGVVSGAGKPYPEHVKEMEEKRVDLFISGETSEGRPEMMKESEINYFVCGHYATEVFGIKALGEEIQKEFGKKLRVEFIETEGIV